MHSSTSIYKNSNPLSIQWSINQFFFFKLPLWHTEGYGYRRESNILFINFILWQWLGWLQNTGTLSDQGNKTKHTNFENYLSVKMMNYRMKHVLRRILFHKTNSLSDYPTTKEKKKHFPISKQNVCLLQLIPHNFG